MVVLFKKLREIVAKTDAIQIMVTSIGDVEDEYNNYRVMNFSPFVCDGHATPEFDGRIIMNITLLQSL